jgi:hypothetical protein
MGPISITLSDTDMPGETLDELRIFTSGSQSWNGDVVLSGNVETTGDVVKFTGTVDADSSTLKKHTIAVIAGIQAIFEGDVGRNLGVLDTLSVRLNPEPNLTEPASVRFGRDDGGAASDTFVRANEINLFAVASPDSKDRTTRAPQTSTLYKKNGNLTFQTAKFTMGTGEKLSVQGDLAIEIFDNSTPNVASKATIGDLSALNIFVGAQSGSAAPTIEILRRAASTYLDRFGTLKPDSGVDFVANTITFEFEGDLEFDGVGASPVFGLAQPVAAPLWMSPYSVLGAQASGEPLTAASFDWAVSPNLPDLHPEGASRDDVSFMLFRDDLVTQPETRKPVPWLPYNEEIIELLDIELRPTTAGEYRSRLAGAGIIDDVGNDLRVWDRRPIPIADARVSGRTAARAYALYQEIFGPAGANAAHLRGILQDVVDQYVRSTGARRVMGFELRRYVKNRPSSRYEAFKVLEDLDLLFALHRDLGLTPGEYGPIQHKWLEAIQPEGITTAQLAEAVRPSRYVRGSDVLDIFGE